MIQTLGELSIASLVPGLNVALGVGVTDLQARIAGVLEAQARFAVSPPTLAANLDAALELVAGLQAAIAIGAPSVDFQLTALASLLAELQLTIGPLLAIQAALSGSVSAYAYAGRADGLGELGSVVPGGVPSASANALLVATTSPGAWASVKTIFNAGSL